MLKKALLDELPQDDTVSCCDKNCITKLRDEKKSDIVPMIEKFQTMSFHDQQTYMMNLIHHSREGHKWNLCGMHVCRKTFLKAFKIGDGWFSKLVAADGPHDACIGNTMAGRRSSARVSADAFFLWLYEELAEDLPETELVEELLEDPPLLVVDDDDDIVSGKPTLLQQASESDIPCHPMAANIEWLMIDYPMASNGRHPIFEKKWLGPTTLTDLYAIYELKMRDGADKASFAVFKREWNSKWKNVIGIRRVGQHASLDKALRICQDKTKKDMLLAERQEHLRSMLADRDLERRLNTMSENSCSGQCNEPGQMDIDGGHILKIDIDGMDQATWKCPCNLESSKKLNPASQSGIISSSPAMSSTDKPQVVTNEALVKGVLCIHSGTQFEESLNRRICISLDFRSLCHFLVLDSASRAGMLEFARAHLHVYKLRAQRKEKFMSNCQEMEFPTSTRCTCTGSRVEIQTAKL